MNVINLAGACPPGVARFRPGEDGHEYRTQVFFQLENHHAPPITKAIRLVEGAEFDFRYMRAAHRTQMRLPLFYRHALPFRLAEEAWFPDEEPSVGALAALLAGHTLALTHLDHHLDGSRPDPSSSATATSMQLATAIGYTIRMIHTAGRLAETSGPTGRRIFTDVLEPYSGFVVQRMAADALERYAPDRLADPARRLRDYLGSRHSRLLGSGYWDVMVRGAFTSHGATVPPALALAVRKLRKLRQLVDEIADFEDDLAAGLVTAPLLFALNTTGGADLEKEVRELWQRPGAISTAEVRKRVLYAGGFSWTAMMADNLWERAVTLSERRLGARAASIVPLLDLKRAKLAILRANDWQNQPTRTHFMR